MRPLIDADILVYQAAFGGQDRETGEPFSFDIVAELIERSIANICTAVGATEEPYLYLTGKGNFREALAITKPYKGGRKEKPFHYHNAVAYILSLPNSFLIEGMEADDAMSIEQCKNRIAGDSEIYTVICTRDKDLLQVPGYHYGWEHHLQPERFLHEVFPVGQIYQKEDGKVYSDGFLAFCYQLIIGDTVDNIPGLPRKGPAAAYKILSKCITKKEALDAVVDLYKETMGDSWEEYLIEQGNLLWMVRELRKDGSPVVWGDEWEKEWKEFYDGEEALSESI